MVLHYLSDYYFVFYYLAWNAPANNVGVAKGEVKWLHASFKPLFAALKAATERSLEIRTAATSIYRRAKSKPE